MSTIVTKAKILKNQNVDISTTHIPCHILIVVDRFNSALFLFLNFIPCDASSIMFLVKFGKKIWFDVPITPPPSPPYITESRHFVEPPFS